MKYTPIISDAHPTRNLVIILFFVGLGEATFFSAILHAHDLIIITLCVTLTIIMLILFIDQIMESKSNKE